MIFVDMAIVMKLSSYGLPFVIVPVYAYFGLLFDLIVVTTLVKYTPSAGIQVIKQKD